MLRSGVARCSRAMRRHISTDLFIKGLHPQTSVEAVVETLRPFGDVTVHMLGSENSNSGHRTAVATFKTLDQAIAAFDEIAEGLVIGKRRVRLDFSNTNKPVTSEVPRHRRKPAAKGEAAPNKAPTEPESVAQENTSS